MNIFDNYQTAIIDLGKCRETMKILEKRQQETEQVLVQYLKENGPTVYNEKVYYLMNDQVVSFSVKEFNG